MLEVEIDVFSGMPNPHFLLSEREESELVDRISAEPEQVSAVSDPTANLGLGYRGIIVRQVKTDTGAWSRARLPEGVSLPSEISPLPGALPLELRLGAKPARGDSAVDWLLEISERKKLAIEDEVWEALRAGVQTLPGTLDETESPAEGEFDVTENEAAQVAPKGATWWACNSPFYSANANVFNLPQYIGVNNCYCFASNHLANSRYALPGRKGGRPATSITCAGVIDGLRADGWIDSCQVNTLTIALVIWPNVDYHFYRVVTPGPEWWWGHKPGATAARYVDNSNQALKQPLSPINCNRGDYIHFCGYFYQNNYTALVA